MISSGALTPEPPHDCALCPRLKTYREDWKAREPDWWCAPAPSAGSTDARLVIVGLAPGLRGANRTGRPFVGDFSGEILHSTLIEFGFAEPSELGPPELRNVMITNAVRCAPPQNKPAAAEINACRTFLRSRLRTLPRLKAILCLGRIAHESTLKAIDAPRARHPFSHGAQHSVRIGNRAVALFDSYHCSRYNTQTKRLTREMFRDVFAAIRAELDAAPNRKETAS